jgi:hypothetical protein
LQGLRKDAESDLSPKTLRNPAARNTEHDELIIVKIAVSQFPRALRHTPEETCRARIIENIQILTRQCDIGGHLEGSGTCHPRNAWVNALTFCNVQTREAGDGMLLVKMDPVASRKVSRRSAAMHSQQVEKARNRQNARNVEFPLKSKSAQKKTVPKLLTMAPQETAPLYGAIKIVKINRTATITRSTKRKRRIVHKHCAGHQND